MKLYLFIVLYHTVCVAVDSENGTNIRISPRIDATDDQFPFQVSLQSYGRHICSGAIVNNRFILTSASCVHAQSAKWIYAVLGRLRLNQRIDIKYISEHESFGVVTLKNNLALLRTVQEINFSHWIQPVRLLSSNLTDNENHELKLSGWNELRVRDGLQYQNVSFVQCKAEDTHLDLSDGVVCAENYESLSDFRPDKGSLLSVKCSDGRNYLVGILSRYRTWNTDDPDIYTRISSFLPWIEENSNFGEINKTPAKLIIISFFSVKIFFVIMVLVVKYAKSGNNQSEASSQSPAATLSPIVSSISRDYTTPVSNLNSGVSQPYVSSTSPMAPSSSDDLPPKYEDLFPNKSDTFV